jgi:hypothetical protein
MLIVDLNHLMAYNFRHDDASVLGCVVLERNFFAGWNQDHSFGSSVITKKLLIKDFNNRINRNFLFLQSNYRNMTISDVWISEAGSRSTKHESNSYNIKTYTYLLSILTDTPTLCNGMTSSIVSNCSPRRSGM